MPASTSRPGASSFAWPAGPRPLARHHSPTPMPEGDTIARAAAVLDRALAGQAVTAFAAVLAPVAVAARTHPPVGRTVEEARAHGKHLVIALSGGLQLRTHLRMHGSWHLYRHGERWQRSPRALRLRLDTAPWIAVAFDVYDAELVVTASAARLPAVAAVGPDLLDPALDHAAAVARLAAHGERAIADVLLDQRVLAGLGNVYRSELLFLVGLHPRLPVSRIDGAVLARLVTLAVGLLSRNARAGAGRRVTTGRLSPAEALWVYRRTRKPCRRCGTPVASDARGPVGRREYWCPRCQPEGEAAPA